MYKFQYLIRVLGDVNRGEKKGGGVGELLRKWKTQHPSKEASQHRFRLIL